MNRQDLAAGADRWPARARPVLRRIGSATMQSSGKKTRDTIYVMLISGALSVGLMM